MQPRALSIFLIIECFIINFVNGGIQILKRTKLSTIKRVKNYCVVTDGNTDENISTSVKINCSLVSGPNIKLEVDPDNYLKLNSEHFVAPNEYCSLPGNSNYGRLCPSHSDTLWRKCCGENEILDSKSYTCRPSRIKYRPKIANSQHQSFVVAWKNSSFVTTRSSIADILHCGNSSVPKFFSSNPCLPESNGIFKLAINGSPMYEASTGVFLRKKQLKAVEHDFYCIDGILDFSSSSCAALGDNGYATDVDDNEVGCQTREMSEVLFTCLEDSDIISNEDGNDDVPKAYFFAALWLSTCPLLLSSAIANSLVIQKNVHGWILTCYLLSMFLVNVNSVILILDLHVLASPNSEGGCGVLDFTMKFIYLSSLCWMSSMCMNMLRTFSSSLPHVKNEPHRFLLSALFSLGFPIISVSVSYYVGSLPNDEALFEKHASDYNNTMDTSPQLSTCQKGGACALYSYKTLPYYSGPIIFLVICNVMAFIKTSATIASLRRQAETVLHQQTRDHLESFALFAKLFLLTGSIWVIRVALLVLQIQGLYVTWYGVILEAVFSIPEVVFPMIIFHHPEFIKWASRKSPTLLRVIIKCSPFCKKDVIGKDPANSKELQSGNQLSSVTHSVNQQYSRHGQPHVTTAVTSGTTASTNITETVPNNRNANKLEATKV